MCTVNSLGILNRYPISLGAILFVLLISSPFLSIANENSSCAHLLRCESSVATSITAPPDFTINISRAGICDTTINLPPAIINLMPGCTLASVSTSSSFQTLNTNGGIMTFRTGVYPIVYCVEDNCRNAICDTMLLFIYDNQNPQLVCIPDAVVSLNSEGEGEIPAYKLDGGSFDNCGHVFFKVKRMTRPAGYECTSLDNPDYGFDDEVRFCCMDIANSPIVIILRAYDVFPGDGVVSDSFLSPHFVDCMIMVTIIDKIGPVLVCPPNATIKCGQDLDSLLNQGQPFFMDNCFSVDLDTQIIKRINSCGFGTVERIFVASDSLNLTTQCTQTITVVKNSIFNGLDTAQLKWPEHTTVYACRIGIDTLNTGRPIVVEDECENVLIRKKDNLYYFNRGGVCGKLLRLWEVIDYCKYDSRFSPNPNVAKNGYYSYYQEVKIIDTIPPEIINARDTVLKSFAADCGNSQFLLPDIFSIDCGLLTNLSFSYDVDYQGDGTIDRSGNGSNAGGIFPMGNHLVTYHVKDSCNNIASKTVNVRVKDGKSPSALVLYGLGTTLQQMAGGVMASVRADQFNNKSEDNCTAKENLKFSFSLDINDTLKVFSCNDNGVKDVEIYVWDECLNYSIVKTFITVLDLNNVCPTNLKNHKILGNITSLNSEAIESVEVHMRDSIHYEMIHSSVKGEYSFHTIPRGMDLILSLHSKKDPTDGISTADIVKIQQHILGKVKLTNEYELIAADVDMNGKITSADISSIRKLILGITTTLPTGQSFVFMNKAYQFINKVEPWAECAEQSEITINNINEDKVINFVGVKLGDVNSSLRLRTTNTVSLFYKKEDNRIDFYFNTNRTGFGMECILKNWFLNNQKLGNYRVESNYFQTESCKTDQDLKIILLSDDLQNISKDEAVFSIILYTEEATHEIQLTSDKSEWITESLEVHNIIIKSKRELEEVPFSILYFGPNPVEDHFRIELSSSELTKINIEVLNHVGKQILKRKHKLQASLNELIFTKEEFGMPGLYTIRIFNEKQNWTQKIFIK